MTSDNNARKSRPGTTGLFKGMTEKKPLNQEEGNIPGQMELPKDYPETAPQQGTVIRQKVVYASDTKKEGKPVTVPVNAYVSKKERKVKDTPVSIWFDKDTKKRLKAMSQATGRSVSSMVTDAVTGYLRTYQLSEDERTIFETAIRILGE